MPDRCGGKAAKGGSGLTGGTRSSSEGGVASPAETSVINTWVDLAGGLVNVDRTCTQEMGLDKV